MSIYEPEENEFLMEDYGMTQSPYELIERDFINAKAYILTASHRSGMNLYDHLANVLTRILDERPENPLEVFEDYCNREKRKRFDYKLDTFLEKKPENKEIKLAIAQKKQFKEVMKLNEEDKEMPTVSNLKYLSFLLEQADLGMGREEMIRVWVAVKVLASTLPEAVRVRFWGKIFGLKHNYCVAEVEFKKDVLSDDKEFMDKPEEDAASLSTVSGHLHQWVLHEPAEPKGPMYYFDEEAEHSVNEHISEVGYPNLSGKGDSLLETQDILQKVLKIPKPPLPEPFYIKPPAIPRERPRTGVNKMAYYVCSSPGQPWVKLPAATPQQISVARLIKKFFTGNLTAPVISYPPFPGNESNYLRAQIARISAGTHISPTGYYQLEEEEEEEAEEGQDTGQERGNLLVNPEYEPLGAAELASPELENWVHHVQYIFEQGRTKWWDPTPALLDMKRQVKEHNKMIKKMLKDEKEEEENEEEEEEAEEEEEEEDEELEEPPEPEEGPPLLTPISEDQGAVGVPNWRARFSSRFTPEYSCAVVESNAWPGAIAIGNTKMFENVYIGWGQKYTGESYQPAPPFQLQTEYVYKDDTELAEIKDPTPAQEDAWMKSNLPREEEEEEEEDEDEGDEDEEDDKDEEASDKAEAQD